MNKYKIYLKRFEKDESTIKIVCSTTESNAEYIAEKKLGFSFFVTRTECFGKV